MMLRNIVKNSYEKEFIKKIQINNKKYSEKKFDWVLSQAVYLLRKKNYKFYVKKNNNLDSIIHFVDSKLRNKNTLYLIDTNAGILVGKNKSSSVAEYLYRYKQFNFKSICFIIKI